MPTASILHHNKKFRALLPLILSEKPTINVMPAWKTPSSSFLLIKQIQFGMTSSDQFYLSWSPMLNFLQPGVGAPIPLNMLLYSWPSSYGLIVQICPCLDLPPLSAIWHVIVYNLMLESELVVSFVIFCFDFLLQGRYHVLCISLSQCPAQHIYPVSGVENQTELWGVLVAAWKHSQEA